LSPRCGVLPHGGAGGDTGPQPCQEIPVEQMSGGELARMRPDLSIGAALGPPGGNVRVAAAREPGMHAPPGRQCRDGS
jgi:hypothetical protein